MILETHTVHKLRKAVGYTSRKYLYIMKEVIIPFVRLLVFIPRIGAPQPVISQAMWYSVSQRTKQRLVKAC